jgi:uncharacterized protein (DUF4213/DUF364 family)
MAKKKTEDKGKHFESKFNEKVLREMIQDGAHAEEIKQTLGIVSMQSLRQHVMKLCHSDRVYYDVKGLYVRGLTRPQVNFKGDLRLTKRMLSDSDFSHGDLFDMEIDGNTITLTRVTDSAEPV